MERIVRKWIGAQPGEALFSMLTQSILRSVVAEFKMTNIEITLVTYAKVLDPLYLLSHRSGCSGIHTSLLIPVLKMCANFGDFSSSGT